MKEGSLRFVLLLWGLFLFNPWFEVKGQDTRFWLDFFGYKSFAGYGVYELNLGSDKLVKDQGWYDLYWCNTVSYPIANWYEIEGATELHKTFDPIGEDVNEFRLFLGQKFIYSTFVKAIRLQNPYLYARVEQRFLSYPEEGTRDNKARLRLRLGTRFMLNRIIMESKALYIPCYFETFFNLDGSAEEHRADQARGVLGIGYALSDHWRGELVYYAQYARNTLENTPYKTDNIFQLQIKYYLDAR